MFNSSRYSVTVQIVTVICQRTLHTTSKAPAFVVTPSVTDLNNGINSTTTTIPAPERAQIQVVQEQYIPFSKYRVLAKKYGPLAAVRQAYPRTLATNAEIQRANATRVYDLARVSSVSNKSTDTTSKSS